MDLTNILNGGAKAMTDENIVADMIAGTKAAAGMYLKATLECATPELRAMYSASLNQVLEGNAAATGIAVDHRWVKPYESPEQQLADAYKRSVSSVEYRK
jgi:spore coat protein CotF